MKRMTGALLAAAMLAAAPAWADRGHDHGRGHAWGHSKHHWKHSHHHYYAPPRVVHREVVRYYDYYPPAPVYYSAPAPGVHIVLPNVYIPIR